MERIYFDPDDRDDDGKGWNIVQADGEGALALRFSTLEEAEGWCRSVGVPFFVDR